jgi:hypothetical protein
VLRRNQVTTENKTCAACCTVCDCSSKHKSHAVSHARSLVMLARLPASARTDGIERGRARKAAKNSKGTPAFCQSTGVSQPSRLVNPRWHRTAAAAPGDLPPHPLPPHPPSSSPPMGGEGKREGGGGDTCCSYAFCFQVMHAATPIVPTRAGRCPTRARRRATGMRLTMKRHSSAPFATPLRLYTLYHISEIG